MIARPCFAFALAVLLAQDVRAQAHLAVEERVLMERIHQELSDVLRDNDSRYRFRLEPGSVRLSFPESTLLPAVPLLIAGGAMFTFVTVVASGTATAATFGLLVGGILVFGSGVSFMATNLFVADDMFHARKEDIDSRILDGYSLLNGVLSNRVEVHYRLVTPYGRMRRDGSCLAFFALGENPDGSLDLHYVLDECEHDGLLGSFPQEVPAEDGDVRIGPDGVDVWDRLLDQDWVVAKGAIPVSP